MHCPWLFLCPRPKAVAQFSTHTIGKGRAGASEVRSTEGHKSLILNTLAGNVFAGSKEHQGIAFAECGPDNPRIIGKLYWPEVGVQGRRGRSVALVDLRDWAMK